MECKDSRRRVVLSTATGLSHQSNTKKGTDDDTTKDGQFTIGVVMRFTAKVPGYIPTQQVSAGGPYMRKRKPLGI